MAGPGHNRIAARSAKKVENPGKILKRVLSEVGKNYWSFII